MGRILRAFLLGIVLLLVTPSVLLSADCQFVLGFETLRDLIGHDIVGECLENEHYNAIGDSNQHTTGGLLAWRKADNWTAFTDGYRTWVHGPNGLQQRLNTERFEWEADYAPGGGVAAPELTLSDTKLAHAAELMRSTPSGETAYQVLSLYQVDVVFGPNHTHGNLLFEPANNRIVVYGKFHLDPPEVLAAFIASGAALVKWFHEHGEPTTLEQCIQREFLATSALDTWNLEKFGSRGKYSSTANTAAERYEREQRGVTYRLSQPLDSQFNNPILCPAVPRIQPVPATAPTPAPAVEYFTWPWTIVDEFGPEARLDHHLKNRGMRVGSSTYRFLARALRVYAYSAYPVYLVLLDSIGVPVKDVGDTEEWEDFVYAYLSNAGIRHEVHSAVDKYMRTTEYLGPILTTYLKGEVYGPLQDKVEFLSLIGTAIRDSSSVYVDGRNWQGECASACQKIRSGLVRLHRDNDIRTLERLPNPWKE